MKFKAIAFTIISLLLTVTLVIPSSPVHADEITIIVTGDDSDVDIEDTTTASPGSTEVPDPEDIIVDEELNTNVDGNITNTDNSEGTGSDDIDSDDTDTEDDDNEEDNDTTANAPLETSPRLYM